MKKILKILFLSGVTATFVVMITDCNKDESNCNCQEIHTTYDSSGRPSEGAPIDIQCPEGLVTGNEVTYEYDNHGRRIKATIINCD